MKWFKRFIVACILLIFCIKPGDSQERTHEYDWIGVWSYKLDFLGIYKVKKSIFHPVLLCNICEDQVRFIEEIVQEEGLWYVLIADDSLDVLKADSQMAKITLKEKDYELTWRYGWNSFLAYVKWRVKPPKPTFLPDGHWLYFSTEKGKIGIKEEKFVRNHQLYKFNKGYNLETHLPVSYYEVKNGWLNGIVYFFEDSIRLKAIVRYKDGVEEKVLYNDNGL